MKNKNKKIREHIYIKSWSKFVARSLSNKYKYKNTNFSDSQMNEFIILIDNNI